MLANKGISLSWKERISTALGAASGMAYLHERDIVHRDLKFDPLSSPLTPFQPPCTHFTLPIRIDHAQSRFKRANRSTLLGLSICSWPTT